MDIQALRSELTNPCLSEEQKQQKSMQQLDSIVFGKIFEDSLKSSSLEKSNETPGAHIYNSLVAKSLAEGFVKSGLGIASK